MKVYPFEKKVPEYFMVDIKHRASRIEINGHSLVNHANADKIVALLRYIQDRYSRSKMSAMTSSSALQPSGAEALRTNKLERDLAQRN